MIKRLFLSLFFLIIISCSFILIKPAKNSSNILSSWFWMKKAYDNSKYELIVFGDSRVYRGVNPDIIEEEINKDEKITCLNYGFSSAGFNKQIFNKIENMFNFKSPQKILIIGITPNEFTPKASKNEHYFTLQTNKIDAFLRINILPYCVVFDNYSLTELNAKANSDTRGYYETYYGNGWVKSDKIPTDSLAALESYKKEFINNKSSREVITEFLLFVSEMNDRGVDVYGYYPPVAFNLRKIEVDNSGFDFDTFKLNFEKSGGKWIDVNMNDYETYDGSHLTSESAIKLSEFLGKNISMIKNAH